MLFLKLGLLILLLAFQPLMTPDIEFHVNTSIFTCQMIVKLICALLAILLEACGVYGEGKFQWNYG